LNKSEREFKIFSGYISSALNLKYTNVLKITSAIFLSLVAITLTFPVKKLRYLGIVYFKHQLGEFALLLLRFSESRYKVVVVDATDASSRI